MSSMQDPKYYTLAALLEGRAHGWAILERVRDMTAGRVQLTAGTLYGTLDRLIDQGLVERGESEIVNGRVRQYFEITDKGSGAVEMEASDRAQDAAIVRRAAKARNARRAEPRIPFAALRCS